MSVSHWMTFGTFAEQRHFVYPTPRAYAGVVINANMVAYAPSGLASFLLEKTPSFAYLIDPQTHAFQHEPRAIRTSSGEVRSSILRLAEEYGEPITSCVEGRRRLLPTDFAARQRVEEFTARCLSFQRWKLATAMESSSVRKYLDAEEASPPPYALVAPYFYMSETTTESWLPVWQECAEVALAHADETKVFGAVVVSQGVLLARNLREMIVDSLEHLGLAGFLLWVDDLSEQTASREALLGLLHLARGLRGEGTREVINLHGGYFSILAAGVLGKSAMSGVAHGPEFGESRPVVPVGGGIPIPRYYVPRLHARVRYREALDLFRAKGWLNSAGTFHSEVCNCDECQRTLSGDPANFTLYGRAISREVRRNDRFARLEFPTTETKGRCLRHYLQRKAIEYAFASSASAVQQVEDLQVGASTLEDVLGPEGVAHLKLWPRVFE